MDDCNRKSEDLIEEIEGLISYVEKGGRDRTGGEPGDDLVQNFESELREIFEHTAVGMYRTTADGRILMANPALVRMLGFSSFEELAHRSLEQDGFEPSYGRKQFKQRIETEGKIVGLESTWTTRQGNRLVIIENARVVRDQDQNVLYYEGTAEDITERKQAEDELRSSEERLRILFESAPDAIYLNDLAGVFVDGNRTAEELIGYKREELIGKNFAEAGLLSAEELPKAIENLKKNARGEPTEPHELMLRRKDGSSVAVEIRTFPVTIDGRGLSLGIARDITQRKRAEEALAESEERYRTLVEDTEQGITLVKDGHMVFANPAMETMLGYSLGELSSFSPEELTALIHPEDRERVVRHMSGRLSGEASPQEFEHRIVRMDGEVRWFSVTATVKGSDGGFTIQTYNTDITERKRAEEALQKAHDELEERVEDRTAQLTNSNKQLEQEVAERKLAEERIVIFRKFAEASEQGLGMADLEGNITYANATLCRLLGLKSPEDACGTNVADYYSEDDLPILQNEILPAVIEGGHQTVEIPLVSIDGTITACIQSVFVIRDDQGKPLCLANVITDITERKKAEDELRKHRDHLEEMVVERTRELERSNEGLKLEIAERKRAERATEERLRFERMLSTISGRFVNLPADEIDKAIEEGLGLVGEFFDVDRVTVSQLVVEEKETRRRHIWLSERFRQGSSVFDRDATYPHVAAYLRRKGAFVYNKPEDLPNEWKEEREFVRALGVKSGVIVPLQVGGVFLEAVSINSLDSERVWPDGTVERLALAGEILANALNRKRAEDELQESEKHYRMLAETMNEGLAHMDADGRYVYVNKKHCEILRCSPDEMIGKHWTEFYEGDARKAIESQLTRRRKGFAKPYEVAIAREDGRNVDLLISPQPIFDEDGEFKGSLSILTDITDLKLAYDELRESERRFRSLSEAAFEGIGFGEKGVLIDANEAFAEIYRCSLDELRGKEVMALVAPEDRDLVKKNMLSGYDRVYEHRGIRKDGSIIDLEVRGRNVTRNGRKVRLTAIRDVTERKRAEVALRDSEEKYRLLVESAGQQIFTVSREGVFEFMNSTSAELLGGKVDDFVGKSMWDLFPPEMADMQMAEIIKTLDSGRLRTSENESIVQGRKRWYFARIQPLQDADGAFSRALVILADITERKQAEAKAREHQSELAHVWRVNTMGEMASGLAHELNQPLCAILNYANACLRMMKKDVDVSGELIDPIEQVASQAERAGEIIKRIRSLVAKRKPQTSPADINDIVAEVVEMEKAEAGHKEIMVRTELAEDLPSVFVDRVEIEEVILNLVRNAFDAMSDPSIERREVTIATCMTEDGAVEVCVRDTGKGFAALGEQIFDSFFTTKIDGLGIGLSISRTIVESHGGKLWAEQNPECGASFRFSLPVKCV